MDYRQVRDLHVRQRPRLDRVGCVAGLLFPLACLAHVWWVTPPTPRVPVMWGENGAVCVTRPAQDDIQRFRVGPREPHRWRRFGVALVGYDWGERQAVIVSADGRRRTVRTGDLRSVDSAYPFADGAIVNSNDDQTYFARDGAARRIADVRCVQPEPGGQRWAAERPNETIEVCSGPLDAPTARRPVYRVVGARSWLYDWRHNELVWSDYQGLWSARQPNQPPKLRARLSQAPLELGTDPHTGDLLVTLDAIVRGWMVSVPHGQIQPRWRQRCYRTATPLGEWRPEDERMLGALTLQGP
ncbi:MAG: hypothetical protein HZB16_15430 [Armatimonadetes bacterium]|nr:hypothetical protein [Armatimonadota bacterium]